MAFDGGPRTMTTSTNQEVLLVETGPSTIKWKKKFQDGKEEGRVLSWRMCVTFRVV
jgi:hypothetical protein